LIEVTLIQTQRRDFADAKARPVAERKDSGKAWNTVALDHRAQHIALLVRKLLGSQSHHHRTRDGPRWIATQIPLVHGPLAEAA
jgi:hypothetical protein